MTVIDDVLAVVRADAEAIEHAMLEGRVTDPAVALPAQLVIEIAVSHCQASAVPGGLPALIAGEYDSDPAAFCARIVPALAASARLHGVPELLPVLTRTHVVHLYAVRVELGWAVLDVDTWRRVVAEPELVGDDLDDCGGGTAGVVLTLEGRGPVTYRRAERVWARNGAAHEAALAAVDRLAEALLAETAGEGVDGA